LDLSRNQLLSISDYYFSTCNADNCPNVIQDLNLEYNPLSSVSDNGFANLPDVANLNLGHCNFSSVPNSVNLLTSLVELNLEYNQIAVLQVNSFSKLQHLNLLNLDGNPITTIKNGAFAGMQKDELEIRRLPDLVSVDLAITQGMESVISLTFTECDKLSTVTVDDYTLIPKTLHIVNIIGINITSVSSNIQQWLKMSDQNILDISFINNYACTTDMQWMTRFLFCPTKQIIMSNVTCSDTKQDAFEYLQTLGEPNCNSAAMIEKSLGVLFVCFLFCYSYLLA